MNHSIICLTIIALAFLSSTSSPNIFQPLIEICNNGIDDDDDGLIDFNDEDCSCKIITLNSLIPNPSFEQLSCCPFQENQLDCATGWIQASEPTTDFLHICGWMGWKDYPPPIPFPDGDGVIGFRNSRVHSPQRDGESTSWKEYTGSCLLSSLEKDSTYRIDMYLGFAQQDISPPIELTIFGTTSCENLPFGVGNWSFGCPTNGDSWVKLSSTKVESSSGNSWVKTSVLLKPSQNIEAIVIGPDCNPISVFDTTRYYFLDHLTLAHIDSFKFQIVENQHPCSPDFSLTVVSEPDLNYQWYKNGIALIRETEAEISQMYGKGEYQVRIENELGCLVSQPYNYSLPKIEISTTGYLCEGESYQFGPFSLDTPGKYTHTFLSAYQCDSTVALVLKEAEQTETYISEKIFEGEIYNGLNPFEYRKEGEHLVTLTSSKGCDSLIYLNLEYYNIYLPNIFSPNGDGINDYFNLFGNKDLIEINSLSIYNRWGNLIWNAKDLIKNNNKGWDARYRNKEVQSGVYPYMCTVLMEDGEVRTFTGTVILIR